MLDETFGVGGCGISRFAAESGILVNEGSTGKLLDARLVNGMVLPMAVSANDVEMVLVETLFLEPGKEFVPFMAETAVVGVIVGFAFVIRTNHRSRRNEEFKFGITLSKSLLEPGFLLYTPNGLFRAFRCSIVTAVHAVFRKPDLQVAADPVRSVSESVCITMSGQRKLLQHHIPGLLGCGKVIA